MLKSINIGGDTMKDMIKNNPIEYMAKYLLDRNIKYIKDELDGIPRITTALRGFDNCPQSVIECSASHYEGKNAVELRVYYGEDTRKIVRNSKYVNELYRLLNFINAKVFVENNDGSNGTVYMPSYIIQPRFYLIDEFYDLTATILMDDSIFFEMPLEVADFITITIPSLLDKLAIYIFGVLLGHIPVEYAITLIKSDLLGEKMWEE